MQQEKRRPTLEELKSLPVELWQLEVSQLCIDAAWAEQFEIVEEAELMMLDPDLTPERIVELRERLQRATGSTSEDPQIVHQWAVNE